jgi:mannose-1-phosphate guanylyltransferase/mannose-6-phosphate isomerase
MADPVYSILLAGGSGTRLWPVSRELYPKQLVSFIGTDSLVQSTIKRLSPVLDPDLIRVVCGEEHFYEISRHMEEIGVPARDKIICEPAGRNTAPAILLAVLRILKEAEDALVCVFPADHVIRSIDGFHRKLATALRLAAAGHIVTFGIEPHYPETGYGYIEGDREIADGALSIRRFVEKPDRETALQYLAAGNFFWNSGMFAFRASVMAEEFRRFFPELLAAMTEMAAAEGDLSRDLYGRLPNISIDYAIMEKTDKGAVLPSDFGWSDIGSWKSLYDFLPKDEKGNVIDGDVIAQETTNCFVMGYDRLIATNHLRDMVVVDTPDSVFVSNIDNSRDVKAIVTRLKRAGRKETHQHRTVHHQWGIATVLDGKDDFVVERKTVYPGSRLNMGDGNSKGLLQITILRGRGGLTLEEGRRALAAGDTVAFAASEGGELVCEGTDPMVLLEVFFKAAGR